MSRRRQSAVLVALTFALHFTLAEGAGTNLMLRSRVSTAGVGPVKIGMTATQARRASGRQVTVGTEINPGCRGDRIRPTRYGFTALTHRGRIAVLSVGRRPGHTEGSASR